MAVPSSWQDRFYPLPNFGAPTSTVANYRETMPQQLQHDQFDVRVDYAITSNNNLYGRVSYKESEPRVVDGGLPADFCRVSRSNADGTAGCDLRYVDLTPRLINELKLGFARNYNAARGELLGQELVDMVGIQGLQPAPGVYNVPSVSIVGFTTVRRSRSRRPLKTPISSSIS